MATRIQNPNQRTANTIAAAWLDASPRMPDNQRDVAGFQFALDSNLWYQGPTPRSFIYLTHLVPNESAMLHALNLDGKRALADIDKARQIVKEIMAEHNLRRLACTIPAPFTALCSAARDLGFVHEGRIREATKVDGRYVDLHLFGLLYHEHRILRRKRRGRRKKKKNGRLNKSTSRTNQVSNGTSQ